MVLKPTLLAQNFVFLKLDTIEEKKVWAFCFLSLGCSVWFFTMSNKLTVSFYTPPRRKFFLIIFLNEELAFREEALLHCQCISLWFMFCFNSYITSWFLPLTLGQLTKISNIIEAPIYMTKSWCIRNDCLWILYNQLGSKMCSQTN